LARCCNFLSWEFPLSGFIAVDTAGVGRYAICLATFEFGIRVAMPDLAVDIPGAIAIRPPPPELTTVPARCDFLGRCVL